MFEIGIGWQAVVNTAMTFPVMQVEIPWFANRLVRLRLFVIFPCNKNGNLKHFSQTQLYIIQSNPLQVLTCNNGTVIQHMGTKKTKLTTAVYESRYLTCNIN